MDISDINNIGHAWASWERDEANKGKGVRPKGWVTNEQMRKNAAQKNPRHYDCCGGTYSPVGHLHKDIWQGSRRTYDGSTRGGFANLLYH